MDWRAVLALTILVAPVAWCTTQVESARYQSEQTAVSVIDTAGVIRQLDAATATLKEVNQSLADMSGRIDAFRTARPTPASEE